MSRQTESFYNRFSVFYPLVDIFLRPQKEMLFEQINGLPYGHVLEIGVGNGEHLPYYKRHKVTGIDTSAIMLARAAGKNNFPNIELLQMNGEALSFEDESFDYVVMAHVIAVADNPDQLLSEAHRVLRPKGRLIILNHFTPDNWLRHVDKLFSFVSKLFHFRSIFRIDDLKVNSRFALVKETSVDSMNYFKLLTYLKK